jgi:queuosine precursor transporter
MVYLYLACIILANVVTAMFAPVKIGMLLVPAGTLLIGATFILRDLVQHKYGRTKTYLYIVIALVLSAFTSYLLGDPLSIVIASAISFAISETTDTEIYTRLKLPIEYRVFYSGLVGGLLDSSIFVIIALSPIGSGFLPWSMVPFAILGQVIFKSLVQLAGLYTIKSYFYKNRSDY